MARVQFDLPAQFSYSTELAIYINHINHGGHLDNAQLISLVSEARTRMLRAVGCDAQSLGELSLVAADLVVQYKTQAHYGERLRIELVPADYNRYGYDLIFKVTEPDSGREVARGKVGIVFVLKDSGKPAPVPAFVTDGLKALPLA